MAGTIRVEVVYALPERQVVIPLDVPAGTTMREAVRQSGITDEFPGQIDPDTIAMGIHARLEPDPAACVLKDGDRVELYRPLLADPNDTRKERAQKAKQRRADGA